jgi:hypothetical protein
MSELQNRIVERLASVDRLQQAGLSSEQRQKLMTAAIGLFFASGGNADELKDIVLKATDHKCSDLANAVARMVVATAAVSYASDLDMVQAAHNWINNPLVSSSG